MMYLFLGVDRIVDSRSEYRIKLVNFKFTAPLWVSNIDETFILKKKIDEMYNPKGISVDDAVKWLLANTPYSSKQIKAKTIKVRTHLELITTNIDTDIEGTYDE